MISSVEIIRSRRQRLRLSVRELANRAGVHEDTLHRLLRGETDPLASTLSAVERALGEAEMQMARELGVRPAGERAA